MIQPGNVYYYRIRTASVFDSSAYTNEVNASTQISSPSGLSASEYSPTQASLHWANSNAASPVSITLERKTGAGGVYAAIQNLLGNSQSTMDSGLATGTTYFYRVRAGIGSSYYTNYSNEASVTLASLSSLPLSIASFQVNPSSLQACSGGSLAVSWRVENAASVTVTPPAGNQMLKSNSQSLSDWSDSVSIPAPTDPGTTQVRLTATSGSRQTSASANVTVAANLSVARKVIIQNAWTNNVTVVLSTGQSFNVSPGGTVTLPLPAANCTPVSVSMYDPASSDEPIWQWTFIYDQKGVQQYCAAPGGCQYSQ